MAVKIEIDGDFKIIKSKDEIINDDFLVEVFPGGFQFIDMGLFIVIAHAPEVISPMNKVGSLFLRYPVYGEILLLSGKELEDGNKFITDDNSKYNPDDSDKGIVNLLRDTLVTFQAITTQDENTLGQQINNPTMTTMNKKQLLIVDPQKLEEPSQDDEEKEFIKQFYIQSFQKLSKKPKDLTKLILFEEPAYYIKFAEGKIIETLNVMLNHYMKSEDYEKCAVIRDVIIQNKHIDQKPKIKTKPKE